MKGEDRAQDPVAVEILEGTPIRVGARELVPLVQVTTRVRRRVTVGAGRLAGWGWGFVRLRPVAMLERSQAGERRIPIPDRTAQALGGMLLAAFIVPLLVAAGVYLVRTQRRG